MIPFNSVTSTPDEANEILQRQRKHVEDLFAKGVISEGLKAQFELAVQAYESGKAGSLELVAYSRFVIPGSECLLVCPYETVLTMFCFYSTVAQKGKKYFTFVGGINHAFSRGFVVGITQSITQDVTKMHHPFSITSRVTRRLNQ